MAQVSDYYSTHKKLFSDDTINLMYDKYRNLIGNHSKCIAYVYSVLFALIYKITTEKKISLNVLYTYIDAYIRYKTDNNEDWLRSRTND